MTLPLSCCVSLEVASVLPAIGRLQTSMLLACRGKSLLPVEICCSENRGFLDILKFSARNLQNCSFVTISSELCGKERPKSALYTKRSAATCKRFVVERRHERRLLVIFRRSLLVFHQHLHLQQSCTASFQPSAGFSRICGGVSQGGGRRIGF